MSEEVNKKLIGELENRVVSHLILAIEDAERRKLIKVDVEKLFADVFINGWQDEIDNRISFLVGRVMNILESLGLSDKQERSCKKMCKNDIYKVGEDIACRKIKSRKQEYMT